MREVDARVQNGDLDAGAVEAGFVEGSGLHVVDGLREAPRLGRVGRRRCVRLVRADRRDRDDVGQFGDLGKLRGVHRQRDEVGRELGAPEFVGTQVGRLGDELVLLRDDLVLLGLLRSLAGHGALGECTFRNGLGDRGLGETHGHLDRAGRALQAVGEATRSRCLVAVSADGIRQRRRGYRIGRPCRRRAEHESGYRHDGDDAGDECAKTTVHDTPGGIEVLSTRKRTARFVTLLVASAVESMCRPCTGQWFSRRDRVLPCVGPDAIPERRRGGSRGAQRRVSRMSVRVSNVVSGLMIAKRSTVSPACELGTTKAFCSSSRRSDQA